MSSHDAEIKRLREALEPFARFADAWDAQPLGGVADQVYTIHAGTIYEASLRLSDCRAARQALAPTRPAAVPPSQAPEEPHEP